MAKQTPRVVDLWPLVGCLSDLAALLEGRCKATHDPTGAYAQQLRIAAATVKLFIAKYAQTV